ncbi:NusG domain II-containing protein [Zongyangia hominis]|uniref:NusG domain II-containing protein n=1 Tax=Zongyangia hominis TaxID=2763677 RepID=A0A926ICF4_9FIRM|nr:NusG domain II-containing protein [Zongyangia hominis]MBC8571065.1 NusG domain II-containing protein [Zongyangia hominis]
MMENMGSRKFRRGDAVAIGILLLIALGAAFFFWLRAGRGDDRIAVITISGRVERSINLTQNTKTETFSMDAKGHTVTFSLEGDRIRFIDAQCPDKICENTGWVAEPGEAAVCLPFETSLKVYLQKEAPKN